MKETVRQARTVILDKSGKSQPVPDGTDPHIRVQKSEVRGQSAKQPADKKSEAKTNNTDSKKETIQTV